MGRTYRMTFTEKELNDLSTILEEYDKELFKQWVRAKNTTYEMYNQDYSLSEFDKAHDVVDYAFRQYIDIQNLYFRILKKYQKIMMSNNSK